TRCLKVQRLSKSTLKERPGISVIQPSEIQSSVVAARNSYNPHHGNQEKYACRSNQFTQPNTFSEIVCPDHAAKQENDAIPETEGRIDPERQHKENREPEQALLRSQEVNKQQSNADDPEVYAKVKVVGERASTGAGHTLRIKGIDQLGDVAPRGD